MRSLFIAIAILVAAACGTETSPETATPNAGQALSFNIDPCLLYTQDDLMFRVTDATTTLRDGVGNTEWRSKQGYLLSYMAMAAPLPNNDAYLTITSPVPACASALADAMAANGNVTIDGSTSGVRLWRGGNGAANWFFATFTLSRPWTQSAMHTISVNLPSTRFGGRTLTQSVLVQAELTNPFTFVNKIYSGRRCTTCHDQGDNASLRSLHGNEMTAQPGDFKTCEFCHVAIDGYYGVDPNDFEGNWRAPPFSFGIQWSQMTPHDRCAQSVARLTADGTDAFTGIVDHFSNDKRVRWAVEMGNPHEPLGLDPNTLIGIYECPPAVGGPEEWTGDCRKTWPYTYERMVDLTNDWAFYALTNPDACSNILTNEYPVNSFIGEDGPT